MNEQPTTPVRLYTLHEVARLAGINPGRLRHWARIGLLAPGHKARGRARYSFRDLVAARAAAGLMETGLKATQIQEALSALTDLCPDVPDPLCSLRVYASDGRLIVHLGDHAVEPLSGQLVLSLMLEDLSRAASALTGRVVEVEAWRVPEGACPDHTEEAHRWFEAAAVAEREGDPEGRAEQMYRAALERTPDHLGALLNLGNIHYQRGELRQAAGLYRRATLVDARSAEAHYNLANALDDLEQRDAAVSSYEAALKLLPEFAAAHFNLALVLEKCGSRARARTHWRRFVELSPDSESIEVAQSFLDPPRPALFAVEDEGDPQDNGQDPGRR